ncbi:four-helix bundle copper-binding protein [Tessaracoccus massiliensis]|uniref:four-helix bundle copper-binding protein n=1 Tax=Tessaracoccus massiliensis TaxID=1522311 RepID=UPI000B32735F|nr:four-helix bundle copper-binding protein [Tessaracoccus massiliensis]
MSITKMLETYPGEITLDQAALAECIEACFACAQCCTACGDACLAEDMVAELRHCIRLNQDCADVCAMTGALLTRQTETDREVLKKALELCMAACKACGDECEKHAHHHEHCKVCAESCRRCEEACRKLLESLG